MKKRLVGAAVIISLLVILLPLAFKGPVEQTTESVPLIRFQPPFDEMAIPDEKIFDAAEAEDLFAQELADVDKTVASISIPEPVAAPAPTAETKPALPVTPATPTKPVVKASAATSTKPATATASKPAATKAQLTPTKEGWVVQVGSFESLAKAESVQAFFKSKQIDTVIKQFKLGTKVYHRVRVMPPENKSKAEALAKEISETYKNIDTLVFPYDS